MTEENTPEQDYDIALMYLNSEKWDYAIENLSKAWAGGSEKAKGEIVSIFNDAHSKCDQKSLECLKAIEKYKKMFEFIDDGTFFNDLGICYWKIKDYENAADYFEKATEFHSAISYNNLANCYYGGWGREKNFQKAKKLYKKSGALGSSSVHLQRLLNCYVEVDKIEKASDFLYYLDNTKIRKFVKFYKKYREDFGEILEENKKYKKQMEDFTKEVESLKKEVESLKKEC
jgi:tetratricopeptide (TPR) repeat protein